MYKKIQCSKGLTYLFSFNKEIYTILKTMVVLLVVGIISISTAYSQDAKVSVNLQNKPFSEVLNSIKNQTSYSFWYDSNDVDGNRPVSINVTNETVESVLKSLLVNQNLDFTMIENHIVIKKKESKTSSSTSENTQARRDVSGLILDSSGEPIIGASVFIKGTTIGVMNDIDGKFTLKAGSKDILAVSYMGYITQEIPVGSNITFTIKLQESDIMLEGVVVTALGIKRSEKALTYNVQQLKSSEVTGIKDANFINSIAGKVAGVQINSSASGIGGSSRVVMRGTKSLFGNNNALYVIDGVPLLSTKSEQPNDIFESPDGGDGDGISLINPDDIESMSILTGAAAAALYGGQGANGVILVTTKKGEAGKVRVNYSNSTSFLSPFVMPKFQNRYGSEDFYSWGAKLDTPSSYDPKDFLQTGFNETNSLSVSAGTERSQTYVSAAALNARGIIPNNILNRYNVSFRNSTELVKEKLFLDFTISYVRQNDRNMMTQGQFHNPLLPIYLFPRGDDFNKYKVYERYNPERNFKTQFWPYSNQGLGIQNPYWIANRELFEGITERYSYTTSLKYDVLDWMNVTGRARMDNTENTFTRKIYASSDPLFASDKGNYLNRKTSEKQFYIDVLLNMEKRFGKWAFTANAGASLTDGKNEAAGFEGHLVTVPNLFSYNNIDKGDPQTKFIQNRFHDQSQAIFATAQVGYNNYVFLDVTARNEWPSQLAYAKSSSYFFSSVGLSGILTDMIEMPKDIVSFMKVRASYSEVGNPPLRYLTALRYDIDNGAISMNSIFPQYDLKPERTKAFEVGTNIRFFKNKLDANFTYYNSNTYDQLFQIESAPSTGYSSFFLNAGKVNNWGIEASLGFNHDFGPVGWHTSVTYSMNRNKVKELLSDNTINPITGEKMPAIDEFTVSSSGSYKMILKEGGTMGDIYVSTLKKDHQGYVHVDPESGTVMADSKNWIKAGSTAPKYNLSWRNSFQYKNFDLGFLVDARVGGIGVSATQALMDRHGVSEASAEARDQGGVLLHGSRLNPQAYYSVVGGGTTGVLSEYVYSSTNVRLREASFGYTFPTKWFDNYVSSLHVSLVARNLLMIYHKAPYDPEITGSTDTYYQGLDYFMQPSLRNLGFSVKVTF